MDPLLKPGQKAFTQTPAKTNLNVQPLHIPNALKMFAQGAQAQANSLVENPLFKQSQAAGQALQKPISQGLQATVPVMNPERNTKVVNAALNPVSTFGTPALEKIGVPAGIAGVAGSIGDAVTPMGKVGQTMKVLKVKDLLNAKNTLTKATEKPGSVVYHMNQMANGKYQPIKVRQTPEGLIIEDGRHRLEAASQLGDKELLVEDVTKFYIQPRDGKGRFDIKK